MCGRVDALVCVCSLARECVMLIQMTLVSCTLSQRSIRSHESFHVRGVRCPGSGCSLFLSDIIDKSICAHGGIQVWRRARVFGMLIRSPVACFPVFLLTEYNWVCSIEETVVSGMRSCLKATTGGFLLR